MNKIVFVGTNNFAENILNKIKRKWKILAILSKENDLIGRGKKIKEHPVIKIARKNFLTTFTVKNINDKKNINIIKTINPKLIIITDFGNILDKNFIEIFYKNLINIHPSLLPKYRGASPIQSVILNNEKKTGISIIKMNVELDSGDIVYKMEYKIKEKDNYDSLIKKLSNVSIKCLNIIINKLNYKKLKKQDFNCITYTKKISKKERKINWNENSINIINKIKAFPKYTSAYTLLKNVCIKVFDAKILKKKSIKNPGTIIKINKFGIDVTTGDKIVRMKKFQLSEKKIINIKYDLLIKGNMFE